MLQAYVHVVDAFVFAGRLKLRMKRFQCCVTRRSCCLLDDSARYVKGLNIDPIREADMLWIAEEAP